MYVRESESDPPLGLPLVLRDHVLRGKLKRITVYRQERTAACSHYQMDSQRRIERNMTEKLLKLEWDKVVFS